MQKAFYLPEAHTDMISAVIGEELGLVGIVGVVGLFALFGYAGLQIAQTREGPLREAARRRADLADPRPGDDQPLRGDGLAPLTGVPLPFVSYGNSSLLTTLFAVGLILNVARGGTAPRWQTARRRGRARASPRKEPIEQCQNAVRVVIAAGGTAGHVVPAMAVADELRASGAEVSFLGTRERIEAELVPAAGYEIDFIKVRGIDRRNPLNAAAAALEAAGSVGAARRALRARRGRRRSWAAAASSPARPGWRR